MRWSKLALDVGVQMLTDALGGAKIIEVLLGAAFVVIDAARLVADDEGARHRVVANDRNVERAMEAIPRARRRQQTDGQVRRRGVAARLVISD